MSKALNILLYLIKPVPVAQKLRRTINKDVKNKTRCKTTMKYV